MAVTGNLGARLSMPTPFITLKIRWRRQPKHRARSASGQAVGAASRFLPLGKTTGYSGRRGHVLMEAFRRSQHRDGPENI